MAVFGYEENFVDPNALQEGELIKCIVYDKTYPKPYLTALAELNEENQKNAEVLGTDYKPLLPNHKDGGIVWKYAIIARDKGTGVINEKVLLPGDDSLLEIPNFMIAGQIEQASPSLIIANGLKPKVRGFKEGKVKNGIPALENILPNPYEVKSKSGVLASELHPEDHSEDAAITRNAEKKRLEAWESVSKYWATLTEETALQALNNALSARYGIMRISGEVAEYMPIQIGTVFTVKITSATPYLNIDAFKTSFNDSTKKWKTDIFSKFDCMFVDEEDEYYAGVIKASLIASRNKKKKKDEDSVDYSKF